MNQITHRRFKHRHGGLAAALAGCALLGVGCSESTTINAEPGLADGEIPLFEDFAAESRRVSEDGLVYYVVEGDIALDAESFEQYYDRLYADERDKLAVATDNGTDQVWSSTQKLNITYCVSDAFGILNKPRAIADAREAMAQWMSAANVVFTHVPSQDAASICSHSNTSVRINIVPGTQGFSIACVPGTCRFLEFDYNGIYNGYSWLGVWTHEVGHTLGLAHEIIRPECGINPNGETFRALTGYDVNSSLHYHGNCGSVSTGQMTPTDRAGLAALYGAPSSTKLSVTPAAWVQSANSALL